MEKKNFFNEAVELKNNVIAEIISIIIDNKGKVTFNVEETHDYEDNDYNDGDEEFDESIWITNYYKDSESHECVLTSIDTKYDDFLGCDVIVAKGYDVIANDELDIDFSYISLLSMIDVYEALYAKVYKESK